MSTPEIPATPGNDPTVPTPPVPEPTPEETAAQQAAQEAAAAEAALADQIRALATEIAKQAILEFDPATIRKGTVTAISTGSTPPTVSVTISGATAVTVDGVRYYEHYPPAVDDVVHLLKQGTDLVAIGKIAEQYSETAFTNVPLGGGFTHNGNANGNLQYRRVWDHGRWRVDLAGGVNRSSGTVVGTLPSTHRPPAGQRRTVLAARDAGGGSNVVKIDIEDDGTMNMVGGTSAPLSESAGDTGGTTPNDSGHTHGGGTNGTTPNDSTHAHPSHDHSISVSGPFSESHGGVTYSHTHAHGSTTGGSNAGDSTHNHGSHSHSINESSHNHGSHAHTTGTHHHDVNDPVWISFNGGSSFWI